MRRKEKEINNITEIERIINESPVCRIALSDNGLPYMIPVCFGYSNRHLYFHSANAGKKIDILKKNNNICFEFDIPENQIRNMTVIKVDIEEITGKKSG